MLPQADKIRVQALCRDYGSKKIDGFTSFVALVILGVRKCGDCLHFPAKFHLRPAPAVTKASCGDGSEFVAAITRENKPTKIPVGAVAQQEPQRALSPMFKIPDLLAVDEGQGFTGVAR